MQTGSSGTLIGWKSGQTTFVPLWDRMEGAWLRTQRAKVGAESWKNPCGLSDTKVPMRELQRRRETTGGWGEVEIEVILAKV